MERKEALMSELENVKVGDKLYVCMPHDVYAIETVERITPTLVITRAHRFVKRTGQAQGYNSWSIITAQLATPDDEERVRSELQRKKLAVQCTAINF